MYEKIEICPSCNSKDFSNHLICDDHSLTKESFAIMKCQNCGLLVTSPRPDKDSIGKYYQFDDYISHTDKANNLTNWLYKIVRQYTIKQKTKMLSALVEKKNILDYGCGTGQLLEHLKEDEWTVTGIEPDPRARELAIQKTKADIHSSLAELGKKKFDIITLWHVLEHVHDLNDTIDQLAMHLPKKSHMVIALPNYESYDQRFYKEYWAGYDVPRHLYHFNQQTIKELMKYHSFKLVKTKPMKFDSFYVSLLSEKYKNGKAKLLKAFLIGLLSNRWARKHQGNYSSIIYIFKKV
ncbi:class I SAM-dependent methyltransferase [Reichenbachiella ulvae]|uniref:Class I SAM-dependent methyltransferase n=1 Tax=Reichenbachiella ulvae TaxID=2980104 RepID=A0ABT3CXJ4_9BACT|nr:class I SAM-dependent methyltransferase [Reichenbachiella ulvae]MCV9388327.1 class I SAM-dependent methyltransferase [Reichenbachiella ulvae]